MTKKTRQEIVSVVEYLKTGVIDASVSRKSINKYISELLRTSVDLPFHFQLNIDELIRTGDRDGALSYIAGVLNCAVFVLDDKSFDIRGLRHVVEHPESQKILDFLENPAKITKFIENNFSLHPLLIRLGIGNENEEIGEIAYLSKDLGSKTIGLVGPLNMNYDLAIGILSYLSL